MARIGLQISDAFSLSFTKFKIRRVRTLLTLISTSILALILVVASSTMTGFITAGNSTPQSELVDLHLASVYGENPFVEGFMGPEFSPEQLTQTTTTTALDVKKRTDDLRNRVKDHSTLREVYLQFRSAQGSDETYFEPIDGKRKPKPGEAGFDPGTFDFESFNYSQVISRSNRMLEPFVGSSQSLEWKQGDPIPVLAPTDSIFAAHRKEFNSIKDARKRVEKRDEYQRAILGKVGQLEIQQMDFSKLPAFDSIEAGVEPPTTTTKTLQVRVVGFLPSTNVFSDEQNSDYVIPYDTTLQNREVTSLLDSLDQFFPSFTTTEARNAFVSANEGDSGIYGDTIESNKQYVNPMKQAFNIAVIVMLILMAIPMAATISKLLADSQRETGVFRAIGARNRNIVSIYGLYSLQMVVASFLLAVVVGQLLCVWLTAQYGDDLELAAADYASATLSVSFVQFDFSQLATIFAGLIAGAAVGIAIPLLRALRRDPIKSLRDE